MGIDPSSLGHVGMMNDADDPRWVHASKIPTSGIARRDPEMRANYTGLIQFLVEPGQSARAGADGGTDQEGLK